LLYRPDLVVETPRPAPPLGTVISAEIGNVSAKIRNAYKYLGASGGFVKRAWGGKRARSVFD
jgi:hypothetical protein